MGRVRQQQGQTAAEYLGLILVVAVIVAALIGSSPGAALADGIRDAVCQVTGADCAKDGGGPDTGSPADRLAARERALAGLGDRGAGYRDLLTRARAARERGDYAEADRILDQLELYERLAASDRGDLIDALNGPSAEEFEALMARETIEEGNRNRRYFQVPPSPGDGVIVMDYYIPTDSSGGLLKGDGRGTVDPLLGDASLDESRLVIVIDRETGRGVITQSQTCAADWVPGGYCESPRPIEIRDPQTTPQINPLPGPQGANEFRVDGGDGTLEVEYDALNSVTPVAISVDGQVEFERGEDGTYAKGEDTRDPYPQIVTGQYRPGDGPDPGIIDEKEDEGVFQGAPPEPVRDAIDGAGTVVEEVCDLPWWVSPAAEAACSIG